MAGWGTSGAAFNPYRVLVVWLIRGLSSRILTCLFRLHLMILLPTSSRCDSALRCRLNPLTV